MYVLFSSLPFFLYTPICNQRPLFLILNIPDCVRISLHVVLLMWHISLKFLLSLSNQIVVFAEQNLHMHKFDTCSLQQNTQQLVCYLHFRFLPCEYRSSTTPFILIVKFTPTVIRIYQIFNKHPSSQSAGETWTDE